jgi:hypothetical protein
LSSPKRRSFEGGVVLLRSTDCKTGEETGCPQGVAGFGSGLTRLRIVSCLRALRRETLGGKPRWDYKTVVLTGGSMGRHSEELRRADLETQFDRLGREGWELAWILMNQALQGEKDGHVVIFKRPLPDSDAASSPSL